ncbi:MAG: hypothetical protein WCF23_14365 [Candidatus Nitrosopolaris sp.]
MSWAWNSAGEVEKFLSDLYDPRKIVEILISEFIKAAEQNKDKIDRLKFALRFVKLLSTEEEEQKND